MAEEQILQIRIPAPRVTVNVPPAPIVDTEIVRDENGRMIGTRATNIRDTGPPLSVSCSAAAIQSWAVKLLNDLAASEGAKAAMVRAHVAAEGGKSETLLVAALLLGQHVKAIRAADKTFSAQDLALGLGLAAGALAGAIAEQAEGAKP